VVLVSVMMPPHLRVEASCFYLHKHHNGSMASRRIVVSGIVQGVGFRAFVRRRAESLGVTVDVWNREDGKVEMTAEHVDPSRLDALQELLWTGPGRVNSVEPL
jgi:acylphosphatase